MDGLFPEAGAVVGWNFLELREHHITALAVYPVSPRTELLVPRLGLERTAERGRGADIPRERRTSVA